MQRLSIQAGLLLTLLLAVVFALPAFAADAAAGQKLVAANGCTGCHVVEGKGGKVGPALDGIGKQLDEEKIMQKLLDPRASNPRSIMPSYARLGKEDLKAIADYLKQL